MCSFSIMIVRANSQRMDYDNRLKRQSHVRSIFVIVNYECVNEFLFSQIPILCEIASILEFGSYKNGSYSIGSKRCECKGLQGEGLQAMYSYLR